MNHNKATGPDEFPVELFDAFYETCLVHFTELLNLIYDTGQWPSDLKNSVFITLQRKPGATECENHRTISLMSHATKILLRIVMTRIRIKIRPVIAESQCGFIPDKGTRNAIFTLSMLIGRAVEVQRDVYLCFIDYSKAFDKVKHSELLGILDQLNIDGKDLRILRNLCWEQVTAIRIDGEYTDFTEILREM
ncbi:RNA-directed DNA polymerase from mobile element jockey-like [Elysia marginata]|uniref:RNA-directed DNA polymerase from mobile element jockey-like n=1 Tax=Elysia marginata TaxID=1093978 RepID=A0AAV4IF24_9GAST|nr:RNA-directed DNA polymerase from mobile element jockey-like [Elysia marginata]